MLKKKPGVTAPKLARSEKSLVHNNPLFSASTAIHVNPLFEPLKNQEDEEEEREEGEEEEDPTTAANTAEDSSEATNEHGNEKDENMVWYNVTETKVEIKQEDDEGMYIDEASPPFSQRELWNEPHNEVLKRDLRKHRDEKQNYSYPMMSNGKLLAPPLVPPHDNRCSIYLNPRRSLPVLPQSTFDTSTAAGSRSALYSSAATGKKRGRDSRAPDAARQGHGPVFKCLLPNCDRTFSDSFSLSEHCMQHSVDFKEFIRRNEEEFLKRTRTL